MADEGLKRPAEELEADQLKRSKTGDDSQDSYEDGKLTIRLLIEDSQVGGIIGKGGAYIKKLRQDSGCRIDVETGAREARERVVTVSGPVSKLVNALSTIAGRISTKPGAERKGDVSLTLLVENGVAGGIIGRAGAKITETRRATGAAIKVSTQALEGSSEKSVQIAGDTQKVTAALEIILRQILAEPEKSVRRPYVPAPDYGDFRGPPPFFDRHGWTPEGPYGAPPVPRGPPGRAPYAAPSPYAPPPRGPPAYGAPPPAYLPPAPLPPPARLDGPSVTVTLAVADTLIGGVIGRGGYKINDIRQRSGAQVKVQAAEAGSSERKIIVTGPQGACDVAIQLINARIKEQQDDRALQQ